METVGTYNERLLEDPLINASQELCSSPLDTVKPCAVVLAIDPTPCAQWASEEGSPSPSFCSVSTYSNHLSWVYPQTEGDKECDQDLSRYRIYYKRYEEDREFTLIDSVWSPVQVYNHINLTSFAGCYYVTVVDRSGNESAPSNIVCQDNC
ncbi:gliding motility-associated C-terminal domain-containing protein, partial [Cytophagaceae bacterium YF14B1]|nr:gliding motility-associated C-terminal domain-containing protein [Xanthocytophaga flavus]